MQSRRFSRLLLIGVFAIIYLIAGKIGLNPASLHASASPVWPPAGIALAAILLLGYRAWPAIFVGAFLVNLTTAGDIATSVAIASGNTLEAVAGAWLVNRFAGGKNVFDRPQGVFKFALAAAISAVVSPLFGVTSLALDGFADWTNYGAIWVTWWLGDVTGDLIFTPLVLLWGIKWKISLEKRGSARSRRPPSVVSAIECSCLWRVAGDLSQKLSHRFYLRPDCDLDSFPLHSTRNCRGYFHSVRNSGVGNSARLWAICWSK